MPADTLLDALANAGESVQADQIERWIAIKRLRPRGYMHQGKFVKTRVQEADNALYSFETARRLLRKDNRHNTRQKVTR
ncbi:Uncharacterised protein [Mycobacteroides abscessus subsp. abscessus]|nr:Uncharacterised protein [Mycobacteroides abscessus subsp. abscessus]